MREPGHILILAGTAEAHRVARGLRIRLPHMRMTASFAGAVSDLPDLEIPSRVGGFGGADGLAGYLETEAVSLMIDATHPFAAQISENACTAAQSVGIPLVRLERPKWTRQPGDNWIEVPTLAAAAKALPAGCRALLAIGRKDIGLFAGRTDIDAVARMIEAPHDSLPAHWRIERSRPAAAVEGELAFLRKHGITHVVSKNSGGSRSYGKIEAARRLGASVILVDRPHLPDALTVETPDKLLAIVQRFV